MIGKNPEFLMSGSDNSPLINLLLKFTTTGDLEAKLFEDYSDPFLACMQLLYEQGEPNAETLPKTLDFLFTQSKEADKTYETSYIDARKSRGSGYVDNLQSNLSKVVNLYLQSINPEIVIPGI